MSDEAATVLHGPWTDRPTWGDLPLYVRWRATKTPARDPADPPQRREDLIQATLEFAGEYAELAEKVLRVGTECFRFGPARTAFLDEVGDVFFCGSWLMDAWGPNALLDVPGGDPDDFLYPAQVREWEKRRDDLKFLLGRNHYDPNFWAFIYAQVIYGLSQSGLLCNSLKKLHYQGRPRVVLDQVSRIGMALEVAAKLAVLADATIKDCLEINVRKLEARYPEGPTPDGGIRTGVGA